MARPAGCPLDPPAGLPGLRAEAPLVRVRLWVGSTPWLVTRHGEQRVLLADRRVSADITRAGYPHATRAVRERAGRVHTLINMDDPEHARLRRMLTAFFTIRRTEAMRPAIQGIADHAIGGQLSGRSRPTLSRRWPCPSRPW
jgi:cytochrome P450